MSQHLPLWIDPHIHLFALSEGQYHWLKPSNMPFWPDKSAIAKNTAENDLLRAARGQLAGFVHIEAGFDNQRPWREIAFLERHCTLPFRSVACIDLTSNDVGSHIDKLKTYSSVRGLRHILDDDASSLLRRPDVQWGLRHMAARGLSFDAQFDLADSHAVRSLLYVLEREPTLRVVVNHCAVAPLSTTHLAFKMWRNNLRYLAETGQVAFKFSGLEMQERNWQWPRASFVLNTLLETVEISQLMFASNYPLCQWRMPYEKLWQGYLDITAPLSEEQKAALFSLNAKHWYDIV